MVFLNISSFICCSLTLLILPQIEPVIEQIDIVYHMLLYRCPSFVTEEDDRPCSMGDMEDTCFGVVAAWAVGGGVRKHQGCLYECLNACQCFVCAKWFTLFSWNPQVFALPENVGIPIGGADSGTIYRLEIHYNNPRKEAGTVDNVYSVYL